MLDTGLALGVVALALAVAAVALLARHCARQRRALQRAEAEVAASRSELAHLHQALHHAGEIVVTTDARRCITWANAAFERVTGHGLAEVLGRRPGDLLQCEQTDPETVRKMRRQLDAAQPFHGVVLNRAKSGQHYWLELHISPVFDAGGRLSGFVAIETDITERRRSDARLAASVAMLDQTSRIARVGGWSHAPGSWRLPCTGQLRRMLGLEIPTMAAAEPEAALDDLGAPRLRTVLRCFDAVGRRRLFRMARECRRDGGRQDLELAVTARSGESLWLRVHAAWEITSQGPRLAGAVMDNTARHGLKDQLRRQVDLMRGAIETVDEALALYDPADRLVYCNERYRELYALSRDAIRPGTTFETIIRHGAERGQYEAANGRVDEWVAQRLAAHRAGDRTLVQRLANGRILRVVDRKMADGHTVGFRIDITELVRATEAAERADEAKTQFIAMVSHELRTPLQVITGFADLGRHFSRGGQHDVASFEPMFEDIHAAGERMLRLVNGLLDVSKIDGTVGSLELKRGNVAQAVQSVAHELRSIAEARPTQLVLQLPAAPLWADLDAFRLQQVLRNVIANAIRFAPPATVIEIAARDLGAGGVDVTITDQGPGIPADELEAVFEPFVQSSRTRDGSGGTGLGLAISRRLMGAHGGTLHAELPPAGGTCMRLWLPPPRPEPVAPSAAAAPVARKLLRSSARPPAPVHAASASPDTQTDPSLYI